MNAPPENPTAMRETRRFRNRFQRVVYWRCLSTRAYRVRACGFKDQTKPQRRLEWTIRGE